MSQRTRSICRIASDLAQSIATAPEPHYAAAYGHHMIGAKFCSMSPFVGEIEAVRMLTNLRLSEYQPDRPRCARRVVRIVSHEGDFMAIFISFN